MPRSLLRPAAALFALILCACSEPEPEPYRVEMGEHALTLLHGTRPLAEFRTVAQVPDGVDPVYARAGYLHPVFTPSGAVVTGDYPASHRHQHGVFAAWTRTRFEGREIDFWNVAERQGVVEVSGFVMDAVTAEYAGLKASLDHVDLTHPAGRSMALTESWHVRASARADATVIAVESVQRAPDAPLELLEHAYGGFAARGPEAWEGADGVRALTSEGHDRVQGNATRARWVALSGPVAGGGEATLAVLASPDNPRAPEPVRIHPDNPYFCFAACQAGAFRIEPDAPRTTRYRIVAMDGPPDPQRLDELWEEFARSEP